jgi:hypothetical protein
VKLISLDGYEDVVERFVLGLAVEPAGQGKTDA